MGVADVTATDLCTLDLFVSADNFHLAGDRLAKNRLSFKLMQRLCSRLLPFWGFPAYRIRRMVHPIFYSLSCAAKIKSKTDG